MKNLIKKYVDEEFRINLNGLEIYITVIDIKFTYGRYRFLVTPVAGKGEIWVESFIGLNPQDLNV